MRRPWPTGGCRANNKQTLIKLAKAIPVNSLTGSEGSRNLRFPEFLHNRHVKAIKFVSRTHPLHLPPGHITGTRFI